MASYGLCLPAVDKITKFRKAFMQNGFGYEKSFETQQFQGSAYDKSFLTDYDCSGNSSQFLNCLSMIPISAHICWLLLTVSSSGTGVFMSISIR